MTANPPTSTASQRFIPVILRSLGSMNLAIILLVTVAIASVIGTILRQNEPYQNYIIKFGPFWHEFYKTLGLYDVYSCCWFIFILAFLVVSTSICVIRNAPEIIRSIQRFKEDIQEHTLCNMTEHSTWITTLPLSSLQGALFQHFIRLGYRVRIYQGENHSTIAAMKGAGNRLGYLLTHTAIIIICVGGLIDGNLPLKIKSLSGNIKIETRDIPIAQIAADSKLSRNNPSFRASVSIPEGATIDYAFVNIVDGYVVQPLPFAIEVKDFRVEHYSNGQPKSFESDLLIHDPESKLPMEQTIGVNHPLIYKGYTIYQSSFGDGGTRLKLHMRVFHDPELASLELDGTVKEHLALTTPQGVVRLEFDDFRRFNVFPITDGQTNKKFSDHGPSFSFKVRQSDGTAKEYINYMYPVSIKQRDYYLSGVRSSPAEEFQYLYIPSDIQGTPDRFFRFQALLHDDAKINIIASNVVQKSFSEIDGKNNDLLNDVSVAMVQLVKLFRTGGFDAISRYITEHVPKEKHEAAAEVYIKVLQNSLREIYLNTLREEGINTDNPSEEDMLFFDDAVNAISGITQYGTPFYLQLESYDHKEATGLQITRTPGEKFVYLGFIILISGIFLLFFVSHQRLWAILRQQDQQTHIVLAGVRTRHRYTFAKEFQELVHRLDEIFNQHKPPG